LADFLEAPYTDDFLKEISDKCSFEKLMKASDQQQGTKEVKMKSVDGTNFLFRKG